MSFLILTLACLVDTEPIGQPVPEYGVNRCGPHALFLCAAAIGRGVTFERLEAVLPDNAKESSLEDLRSAAARLGLAAKGARWPHRTPFFTRGDTAAVIPVSTRDGRRHFLAVIESRAGQFLVIDFPRSPEWRSESNLREYAGWDGSALVVASNQDHLAQVITISSKMPAFVAFAAAFVFACGVVRRRHRRTVRPSTTAGFTIVELLVTLSIVSLLLALIAPAVQHARNAAAMVKCKSNLRQIGLASHSYADVYNGVLPPAMTPHILGRGNAPVDRNLSPQARLLPFLEHTALWATIDQNETGIGDGDGRPSSTLNAVAINASVDVFECPSDSVPRGGTSYRMCKGSTPGSHQSVAAGPNAARVGVARLLGCPIRLITDGMTGTAMFSERVVGDQDDGRYDPWRDRALLDPTAINTEPDEMAEACRFSRTPLRHFSFDGATWLLTSYSHTLYNHVLSPNSNTPDCEATCRAVTARSHHAGGVHVLFCDGAVKLVSDGIDLHAWRAAASIDGGESVGKF
ncbi:MAG: DUF1559 domain-containing protein [Planctomycetaceae bacterium]|nr:DUF1559 domain-containing protein [Planctomycetaceae bacterium]